MGGGGERRSWADSWLATVASFIAAMVIVLREPIRSGFDRGFGDRGDALIAISIQEHWRNVLSGVDAWNRTLYFHPYPDTLGYNDGYFLSGILYSGWRMVSDPLLADILTASSWKALGFAATWWLVHRTLKFRPSIASLAALIFTISNGMFVQAEHAQLNSIALLPVTIILAVECGRAEIAGAKNRARLLAIALAGLLGAWLLTAYYMAWFTLWFTLVFAVIWAILERPSPGWMLRAHGVTLAVFIAAFGLAVAPFLFLYAPKVHETGGQHYREVQRFLILPSDLINVSPQNLAWGWLIRAMRPPGLAITAEETSYNGEHETGFPLLLLLIALISAYRAVGQRQPTIIRAFALAVLVSWLLAMQLGGSSAWRAVYAVVPGATGLRVVLRYQLFLLLPLILMILLANRDRVASLVERTPWVVGALALLLVFEQLNAVNNARLPRRATLAAFEAVPPPPPACLSFYVIAARVGEPMYRGPMWQMLYPHNVDGMLLAELWRVPTINGFSTFNPPDWAFDDPLAADYDARAEAYANRHQLTGLCRLDARQAAPWSLVPARAR